MATTGQTINDRINAVRYALVGQGLARTVCKATTEEVLGPKKKHIDYLLACTNEPNVSIPQLANLLIERTQHTSWAVVFKALTSIHHLMSYGNERFTQYLATSNHSFELNDFMDRTTPQGYNMSTFVRKYAKYINDKSISYRTLAIDLCKIRSGNDNALRTMNMDNLSKTLPIVQAQFDSLLDFGAESKDLNNGIIMSAFRLLYKDLVRLYVAYQEAIINLLERYFKLSRKKTREALEMYKKYLARMDKVAGFLRVVDAVGLDKSEMPDLTKSPASILKLLEQHLATLEAKKRGTTPASPENQDDEEDNKQRKEEEKENVGQAETKVETASEATSSSKEAEKKPTSAHTSKQASGAASEQKPATATPPPPPQKPARPSPKASPKSDETKKPSAAPDKKAPPPSRPAKPPTRPSPPSAAAPPPSSSSSQSMDNSQGKKTASDASPKTQTKPASTPPPHPPPPHPAPPATIPAPSSPSPSKSNPSSTQEEKTHQEAPDDADKRAEENGCEPSDEAPASSCSVANISNNQESVITDDTAQASSEGTNHKEDSVAVNNVSVEQEAGSNHVENHEAAVEGELNDGEEMPPPPPPIDDEPQIEELAHSNGQDDSHALNGAADGNEAVIDNSNENVEEPDVGEGNNE